MPRAKGFTLLEILVVIVILGIAAALFFPNYTTPTEQARAANAQNNLLAIYSAEQNYRNNNGNFASPSSLSTINSTLSLNIQDDGTYLYSCSWGPPPACTATRTNSSASPVLAVTLNSSIQLHGGNPTCTGNSNWCP